MKLSKLRPLMALRPPEAVVKDELQVNQQLQGFFWFALYWFFSICYPLFPMFRLSSCCVPWPLAYSPFFFLIGFYCFTCSIFRFASFVPTFFPLRAFLSLPTCVCILFSLVIIFDVPLRCFVPPLVFYEIYLFVVVFFPLTSALICFIRMAALSRAKHLTSLYFAIIFSVVF